MPCANVRSLKHESRFSPHFWLTFPQFVSKTVGIGDWQVGPVAKSVAFLCRDVVNLNLLGRRRVAGGDPALAGSPR
jgi:hypothetical protein